MTNPTEDKRFMQLVEMVFDAEGRTYTNYKDDYGGKTNWGLTQIAYDEYCRTHQNAPRKEVKDLSEEEIRKVFYEDYYVKSGASKEKNIMDAYTIFDTSVNFHPITAKAMWEKSGHDAYKMLDIRRQKHTKEAQSDVMQANKLEGWLNRCNDIERKGSNLLKTNDPELFKQSTPFDDNYNGALQKVNQPMQPEEQEKKRTKYLYMLKNKGIPTGLAASLDEQLNRPLSREQIGKMSTDEFILFEHKVNNDLSNGVIGQQTPDITSFIRQLAPESTIFTKELLNSLSTNDIDSNLANLTSQQQQIGMPSESELLNAIGSSTGDVHVNSYTRATEQK